VGLPPERGPPAATIVRRLQPELEQTAARDFRINDAHGIGQGSLREKAQANIAAIRTLKQIESENRDALEPEQLTLVRYTGWGAMANAFRPYPPQEWERVARDLRELLTDDEYSSARASTPNAHFTSPMVIQAMWQAMQQFGLRPGGRILEPSMGVGHFLGLMPDELSTGTRRTGVELDGITARIAQRLYPDSTIFAKGFEDTPLPDNFFDAVIGNIPFGNYAVYDPAYRCKPSLTRTIHDYFFAKSLDKTRVGGVMALITSHYTMDKYDTTVRRTLAERTDLIGAIRLPNTAFKANAGTEVTTDILFLQKRAPGAPPAGQPWTDLAEIETQDGPVLVNEYFAGKPEMMLGQMHLKGTLYRNNEPSLIGDLSPPDLARAISLLPSGLYATKQKQLAQQLDITPPIPPDLDAVKDGA
jgi:N-6 DNA Methylase